MSIRASGMALVVVMVAACSAAPPEATGTTEQAAYAGERLTPDRIAALARGAGLPCDKVVLATAVALGESDGYVRATHGNGDGSVDRGLWQINSLAWPMYGSSCVFDPACNASAMAAISGDGSDFRPWLAFTNGRYQMFYSEAQAAYARGVPGCGAGGGGAGGGGTTSAPTEDCASLGYFGACYGTTLVWFEAGRCRVVDCADTGRTCGLDGANGENCL